MTFDVIDNYQDFCIQLRQAGFAIAADNDEGIFSLSSLFSNSIQWHTGDPQTDPWAWRMRVLEEETDIGYGKLFFHKGGFMTREWAPYFLCAKRRHENYQQIYQQGRLGYLEKSICQFVAQEGEAALHEIKAAVGAKGMEAALARLQTGMFLTICGQKQKLSKENVPYGWPATTFQLTEAFWGKDVVKAAAAISVQEACDKIRERIYELNPAADKKAVERLLR